MFFAILTLLSALSVAGVAGWFSIVGVISIYAGAPLNAALVMGLTLEGAKLVTISWLYRNWKYASWKLKAPLIYFMLALMVATSIGVFGFLTKSHLEQGAATIDNSAKVERIDQQIAREKANIADNEKVIAQLDTAINSYLGNDKADRALSIRRAQAPQRKQLRDEITASQKLIDQYSEEKLKLTSELRALQLEVGPIKYIADLFYGAEGNETVKVEAAVRIFTLLIVSTLDPLAVILLIAANHTILRIQNEKKAKAEEEKQKNAIRSPDAEDIDKKDTKNSTIIPEKEDHATEETSNTDNENRSDDKAQDIETKKEAVVEEIPKEVAVESNEQPVDSKTLALENIQPVDSKEAEIEEKPLTGTLVDKDVADAALAAVFVDRPSYFAPQEELIEELIKEEIQEKIKKPRRPRKKKINTEIVKEESLEIPVEEIVEEYVKNPPTIQVKASPTAHQADALREITGIGPHFIPQKLNEEKKIKEKSSPNYYAPDIPKSITEAIAEVFTASPQSDKTESNSEGEITGESQNSIENTDAGNKYPKALSWIKEFKGEQNG